MTTIDEIDRIARLGDPILRNLQITQCYYEISQSVAGLTGFSANWCTFATWASKQAGQIIRQEDLLRAFEERFYLSVEISQPRWRTSRATSRASVRSCRLKFPGKQFFRHSIRPQRSHARAMPSPAATKKVFEEIGREFARLLGVFRDDDHLDRDKTASCCAGLRPGEPPDGQRLLSEAFTKYCEARFETGKEKAELMLLANLCAGFHEQIRLQPEIAKALNASLGDSADLKRHLLTLLLPDFIRARARVLRKHQSYLDGVFDG